MSDQGFDFSAPQRRETKPFEPPPWEQEAFEQLQRKKAAEQADDEQAESDEVVQVEAPDPVAAPVQDEGTTPADEVGEGEAVPETKLNEARVLEMMARLAEQEPKLHEKTWRPALFSAMFVAAIGAMMTVWGVAAMVSARGAGLTAVAGALVLMSFGVGFVAIAVWITVRTLRQRGVL